MPLNEIFNVVIKVDNIAVEKGKSNLGEHRGASYFLISTMTAVINV